MCCLSVNGPQDEERFLLKEASVIGLDEPVNWESRGCDRHKRSMSRVRGKRGRKSDLGQLGIQIS